MVLGAFPLFFIKQQNWSSTKIPANAENKEKNEKQGDGLKLFEVNLKINLTIR